MHLIFITVIAIYATGLNWIPTKWVVTCSLEILSWCSKSTSVLDPVKIKMLAIENNICKSKYCYRLMDLKHFTKIHTFCPWSDNLEKTCKQLRKYMPMSSVSGSESGKTLMTMHCCVISSGFNKEVTKYSEKWITDLYQTLLNTQSWDKRNKKHKLSSKNRCSKMGCPG